MPTDLHHLLDWDFGPNGLAKLTAAVDAGADPNAVHPETQETPLHVAARRRRREVVQWFVDRDLFLEATDRGGKTALMHAKRRGFDDVAGVLEAAGARLDPTPADQLAIALSQLDLETARRLISAHPDCVRTGNPEEDRLLADVAGRREVEPVSILLQAGAPLDVPAMDDGTPLHQAAWFGQLQHVCMLIDHGAPLDRFDRCHQSSPSHWAIHGAQHSDTKGPQAETYAAIVGKLLQAGSSLEYPAHIKASRSYRERLFDDAPPLVHAVLVAHLGDPQ
jgi:ankyrin repeat protein